MRWSFDDTICTELVNSFIVTATGFSLSPISTTFPSSLIFLYDLKIVLLAYEERFSFFPVSVLSFSLTLSLLFFFFPAINEQWSELQATWWL